MRGDHVTRKKPRAAHIASAQSQIIVVAALIGLLAAVFVYKKMQQPGEEPAPQPLRTAAAPAPAVAPTGKTFAAETLLPDSAYFLLKLPDAKASVVQFKRTSLYEIAYDPAVKEALTRFMESIEEMRARIEVQYGLNLSEFLANLRGQCAMAALPPDETGKPPDFVFLADMSAADLRLRALVDNVLKRWILSPTWIPVGPGPPKAQPKTPRGRGNDTTPPSGGAATYTFKDVEITAGNLSGINFHSALFGDTYVLASSKKAIEDVISVHTSKGGSLAGNAVFARVRARSPQKKEEAKNAVEAFINIQAMLAANKGSLTAPLMDSLERAGLAKATALSYTAWLADKGVKERIHVEAPEARSGLVALVSQPSSKRELLRFVPQTALWFACCGMEPASLWTAVRNLAATGEPGAPMKFEKDHDLDIQRDLCPSLGREMVVYGGAPEFESGRALPSPVFVLSAGKPAAAGTAIEKLLQALADAWPAPPVPETPTVPAPGKTAAPPSPKDLPPVKVASFFSDVPHRNHILRVLTPPEKSLVPSFSLAVGSSFVLVSRTPEQARLALDVMDGLRPSVSADKDFAEALKQQTPGESVLAYYNTRQNLEIIQRLAREQGQEFLKEQNFPIDYARLSLADAVAQRFTGAVVVIMSDRIGVTLDLYSCASLAGTLALTEYERSTGLSKHYAPTTAVMRALDADNLARIGAVMRRFAADHQGAFPGGGRQASELVTTGYASNLRLFYHPTVTADFSGFPENSDYQFTILNFTLADRPKTPVAWNRRKDSAGGRNILLLDGTVEWIPEQQFIERMK